MNTREQVDHPPGTIPRPLFRCLLHRFHLYFPAVFSMLLSSSLFLCLLVLVFPCLLALALALALVFVLVHEPLDDANLWYSSLPRGSPVWCPRGFSTMNKCHCCCAMSACDCASLL
jgi:hypothetical protein